MKSLIIKLWRTMTRPAVHISLGVLTMGGFIAGVIFWGGFNTALEATNTEEFCISCHTMRDNVYVELQDTVHWKNHSGVRATCPDCHVPHNWTDKIARKITRLLKKYLRKFLATTLNLAFSKSVVSNLLNTNGIVSLQTNL